MNFTCILFGAAFSIAGGLFAAGKLHPRLSLWKDMSEEEKDKVDILPLCRNIGQVILLSGIIFLLKGLCPAFQDRWFTWAMIAWLILSGLDLWFISRSGRFTRS